MTSQHKDLTSQHEDLKRQHKDLTSQHNYLTSDGRNIPPLNRTRSMFFNQVMWTVNWTVDRKQYKRGSESLMC